MGYETILVEKAEGIGTLTLNRPNRMNAVTPSMFTELLTAFRDMAEDSAVRVVVVTGAGRAFCAGADLRPGIWPIDSPSNVLERTNQANLVILALRQMPKPAIAAVNGVAVGAGCNLALACDIVIASEAARFGELFVKAGISPDTGGTYNLPRLTGVGRALHRDRQSPSPWRKPRYIRDCQSTCQQRSIWKQGRWQSLA